MRPPIELSHSAPAGVINAESGDIKLLTLKPGSEHHTRRYTDITPASRRYCSWLYAPLSPKLHELLEESGTKPVTDIRNK